MASTSRKVFFEDVQCCLKHIIHTGPALCLTAFCWTEQSPDSAKVKEGLLRLQKRLRAEKKVVDEKEKKYKEQQQHIAKLQADLQRITDGMLSDVRFMTHARRCDGLEYYALCCACAKKSCNGEQHRKSWRIDKGLLQARGRCTWIRSSRQSSTRSKRRPSPRPQSSGLTMTRFN